MLCLLQVDESTDSPEKAHFISHIRFIKHAQFRKPVLVLQKIEKYN